MGGIISSVVVGYVTMFVAVFLIFSAAYLLLGTGGSFQAGSWDVSGAWITVSIVVGFVAASAGGYVCAAIARDPRGPLALVVVVVVLGLILAIPVLTGAYNDVAVGSRPETVGLFDAMQNAKQLVWIAFLNPLLGAVGVMIGAKLKQKGTP